MAIHNSISPLNDRGGRRPLIKHPRKLLDRGKSRSKQRGFWEARQPFELVPVPATAAAESRAARNRTRDSAQPRRNSRTTRTPTEGPTCSGGCADSSYRARRRTCAIRPSPPQVPSPDHWHRALPLFGVPPLTQICCNFEAGSLDTSSGGQSLIQSTIQRRVDWIYIIIGASLDYSFGMIHDWAMLGWILEQANMLLTWKKKFYGCQEFKVEDQMKNKKQFTIEIKISVAEMTDWQ
jgi:hypothetical protein